MFMLYMYQTVVGDNINYTPGHYQKEDTIITVITLIIHYKVIQFYILI